MTEPTFTGATEDTYGSLAQYLRAADRRQGAWPLKRYLASILDQFGIVRDLYERIDYLSPDEFGADPRPLELYTNLTPNPSFEDIAPLMGVTNATGARVPAEGITTDAGDWELEIACTAGGAGLFMSAGGDLASAAPIPPGTQTFTVGVDVRAVPGRTVAVFVIFWDASNTAMLANVPSWWHSRTYVGPDRERCVETFPVPVGAVKASAGAGVWDAALATGEQMTVDCFQMIAGSQDHPYRRYAGVAAGGTSELVTPETADDAWLPWLAQLVGVKLNLDLNREAKVDAIRFASAGWQGGTKAAVAAAAKSVLTGTKYVQVFDHSTESGVGTGGEWDVLLVTRLTETPDVGAVLDAVVAQNAKPAGVTLHHLAYNATWATIEATYPTWADWRAAGSWARVEEAGLP